MHVNIQVVKTFATLACPPLLAGPLAVDEADALAKALRVLAEPARLRILSLIQSQPDHEACVCHLTEPLGLAQPTVSHHLKVLRDAGIVGSERRGLWAYYYVNPDALEEVSKWLSS
jgi:ArsR family transcriptional regulator, arsenate/arsenite/antimonite-responsive transcriptional repressor